VSLIPSRRRGGEKKNMLTAIRGPVSRTELPKERLKVSPILEGCELLVNARLRIA